MNVRLVCLHCHVQSNCSAPDEGWLTGECLSCKKPFRTLLATVRSKRSRGSKKSQSREFDVRVRHNGREEMLAFSAPDYGDFELRSSDQAAFGFIKDQLHIVQNFTINQYKVVSAPGGLGLLGWLLVGLAVLVCVLLMRG